MELNHQLDLLRQSATIAIFDRITAMKAAGRPLIGLQVGDPDFATHPAIIEVAQQAMHDSMTHYAPSRGLPELRNAVATKLARDEGVTYDPNSEILVTHGSIHAYYTALQAILNPADEVLIPDPSWATHANIVVMLRAKAVRIPAPAENGFIPPFESWEQALTDRTRAIVINYPSNPTGAYPSREYLQRLGKFAEANGLWIISDEVYNNLYYGDHPVCAAIFDGAKKYTLVINSLSKTYAMTGWRVGFLAAPAVVIENSLKASQNSITCVAPFVQKAAEFALTDPAMQDFAAQMRSSYAGRRKLVMSLARARESGKVIFRPAQGTFYFFLDFRPLNLSSVEICEHILDEAGVGLVPGSAFGAKGEGFVRMSISASDEDVEKGVGRILEWAELQKKP